MLRELKMEAEVVMPDGQTFKLKTITRDGRREDLIEIFLRDMEKLTKCPGSR